MADLSITAYESFFALMSGDGWDADSVLTVNSTKGFSQVFVAQSSEIESIMFMADIDEDNASDLQVSLYSVTATGGGTVFTLGSLLCSTDGSSVQKIAKNTSVETSDDIYWYSYSCSQSVTSGSYYAVVFEILSGAASSHNIYFSDTYREDVFIQVMASTDSGATWSNDDFTEAPQTFAENRLGALSFGFLGNELISGGQDFTSGGVVMGGSDAKRGHPVFLFIKKTGDDVRVSFTMNSPSTGTSTEANRADMAWYWYNEGTMPIANAPELLNKISSKPRLTTLKNFALFTQPEKMAPYPKIFFPEISVTLSTNALETKVLKESYVTTPIQQDSQIIFNNSGNFNTDNWAHFTEEQNAIFGVTGDSLDEIRNTTQSVNPSYIDFSLEGQLDLSEIFGGSVAHNYPMVLASVAENTFFIDGDYVDEVGAAGDTISISDSFYHDGTYTIKSAYSYQTDYTGISVDELTLSTTTPHGSINFDYTKKIIRGYTNLIKYDGYYMAFAKYISSAPREINTTDNDLTVSIIRIPVEDVDTGIWEKTFIKLKDQQSWLQPVATGAGPPYYDTNIVGVFDARVEYTGTNLDTETLFVVFQSIPDNGGATTRPFFTIGHTTESHVEDTFLDMRVIYAEGAFIDDGRWEGFDEDGAQAIGIDDYDAEYVDYKGAKFVSSPNNNYALVTALNNSFSFGMWKIDLSQDFDFNPSPFPSLTNDDNYTRGFLATIASETSTREVEISFVMRDAQGVYYGTRSYDDTRLGEVFFMDSNFNVEKIIDGDLDQDWLEGYTNGTSGGVDIRGAGSSYHYNTSIPSKKVSFMVKVGDILHVWMTPLAVDGTPFHIAHDTKSGITKVLRRFPIEKSDVRGVVEQLIEGEDDSKDIDLFEGGTISGENIYVIGMGPSHGGSNTSFPRCLVYDRRTINHAFTYFNDFDYHIYNTGIPLGYGYEYGIDTDGDGYPDYYYYLNTTSTAYRDKLLYYPHVEILSSDKKYGSYTSETLTKLPFYKRSKVFNDYPALRPTEDNPRIGVYCGTGFLMNDSNDILIENDDFRPQALNQNGIPFMVCGNEGSGVHLYKFYGLKQDADDWGLIDGTETTFSDGVYTTGTKYNLSVDKENSQRAYDSPSDYKDKGRLFSISEMDGEYFVSFMRRNEFVEVDTNDTLKEAVPERYIYKFNAGSDKPQNFSFYYKLNYLREPYDRNHYVDAESTILKTDDVLDKLSSTGVANLKIKYANTWEDLYYAPVGEITVPLAFPDVSTFPDQTSRAWYHYTSSTDIQSLFWRIESSDLITPYNDTWYGSTLTENDYRNSDGSVNDPYAEILIKGFQFNDVDLFAEDKERDGSYNSKKRVGSTGIVGEGSSPEDFLNSSAILCPEGEIVLEIPTKIYVSEISFKAKDIGDGSGARFGIHYLPAKSKTAYGTNLVVEEDWIEIGYIDYTPANSTFVTVGIDSIRKFVGTLRIKSYSSVEFEIKDLVIKTFATGTGVSSLYSSSSGVSNPEMIAIDDIDGLLSSTQDGESAAYATFTEDESNIIIDLGDLRDENDAIQSSSNGGNIPVNRISMQFFEGLSRSVKIEVSNMINIVSKIDAGTPPTASSYARGQRIITDGWGGACVSGQIAESDGTTWTYETPAEGQYADVADEDVVYLYSSGVWTTASSYSTAHWATMADEIIPDYEYTIVDWTARTSSKSDQIYVEVLTGAALAEKDPIGLSFNHQTSNYSQHFSSGALRDRVFRTNINKSRNIPIIDSESYDLSSTYDGILTLNAQMNEEDSFKSDQGETGIIENILNVAFPVRTVRKIRITLYGFENDNTETSVRANGFKVYTPIVDSDGIAVWPSSTVTWNVNLSTSST